MPHTPSGDGVNTSIEHRALYGDRKNPFSVATLFGKKTDRHLPYLSGGLNPLKNMKINWDDYSQYMEK